jgi:hypothetical protein
MSETELRPPAVDCCLPPPILPVDHTAVGEIFKDVQFGESVVFGDTCFLKSDSKYWKADDTDEDTIGLIVIALGTYGADAYGDALRCGFIRDDSWNWTVAGRLFVPNSKGPPTQTPPGSGKVKMIIGYATHADRAYIGPDNSYVEVP